MGLQAKLFAKILKVASGVEKIEKSGYNKHQNYHYSTEQDLINSVRNLLMENKLIVLTDSETKEVIKLSKPDKNGGVTESLVTVVNTRHTFCDTETGATYPIQSTGAGHDPTDKGVFKGITGAMKYFISKNFLVPTEDDPESDGGTKQVVTAAPKGFNRSASTTVAKAADPVTISKEADVAKVTLTSAQPVAEVTIPAKVDTVATAKPSFGRRSTTKTEPSFP
jgi:ERF superfamily